MSDNPMAYLSDEMKALLRTLFDLSTPYGHNPRPRTARFYADFYAKFGDWPLLPITWAPQLMVREESRARNTIIASMSRTLRKLEQRGLLQRLNSDFQRVEKRERTAHIALTPAGREVAFKLVVDDDQLGKERETAREKLWESTPERLKEISSWLDELSQDEAHGYRVRTVKVALEMIAQNFEELKPFVNQNKEKTTLENHGG